MKSPLVGEGIRILHRLPGRARIKVPSLYRSPARKREIEQRMQREREVTGVSANFLTATVLIYFRREEALPSLLSRLESQFGGQPGSARGAGESPPDPTGSSVETAIGVSVWYRMDAVAVIAAFETHPVLGLSAEEADRRLERYGRNLYSRLKARSLTAVVKEFLTSVPMLFLSIGGGLALAKGKIIEAGLTLAIFALNAGISYLTERKAEKILALTENGDNPSARVIRNGTLLEIAERDLVPGDILILRPGFEVAADGRVIQAQQLSVDESALTGESMPVLKSAEVLPSEAPIPERANMLYKGTLVTGGRGLAVVTATGKETEFGRLQYFLGEIFPSETNLIRCLTQVGRRMVRRGALASGILLGIGLIGGWSGPRILTAAYALWMAAFPASLSMLAFAALARGLKDLRARNISVRRLGALGNLGLIRVVCLDKTGTLTQNRVTVERIFAGEILLEVRGSRFFRDGEEWDFRRHPELEWTVKIAALCNETVLRKEGGRRIMEGSATEKALIFMALETSLDVSRLKRDYPLLQVRPRSEGRPFMTTTHRDLEGGELIGLKGSPPDVLGQCDRWMRDGKILPLGEEARQAVELQNERMGSEALRVLGVALATGSGETGGGGGFVWLGLIGMADPLRTDAGDLVDGLHRLGIKTVIITGDQLPTAYKIGKALNLSAADSLEILDTSQLPEIPPKTLQALVQRVNIFAKSSPGIKFRILQAYQNSGHTVAMVGDGINDALALRMADVGFTLGLSGTRTARQASDLVIEGDELTGIVEAIRAGRRMFGNVRKTARFLLAASLSETFFILGASLRGFGFSGFPLDSLWLNAACLGLALDGGGREEREIDAEPPWLSAEEFRKSTREAAAIAAPPLALGCAGILFGARSRTAEILAANSLPLGQLGHAYRLRSEPGNRSGCTRPDGDLYLRAALGASIGFRILSLLVPGLGRLTGVPALIGGRTLS